MAQLRLDLQEGFAGDRVVIRVNGAAVYDNPAVKTRMQTGLADFVEVEVAGDKADIHVTLPERGLAADLSVTVPSAPNVGVNLAGGEIVFRTPNEPGGAFGYV